MLSTQRSVIALAFGAFTGVRIWLMPSDASIEDDPKTAVTVVDQELGRLS